jgi:hypothetical protein
MLRMLWILKDLGPKDGPIKWDKDDNLKQRM